MRERPILFSGTMVKAILEGRKTQTRRIITNVTLPFHNGFIMDSTDKKRKRNDAMFSDNENAVVASEYQYARPLCEVGDRLWVRENFKVAEYIPYRSNANESCSDNFDPAVAVIQYATSGKEKKTFYDIDEIDSEQAERFIKRKGFVPSIFMPRWASRITLEVTGVRVERLQDITEEDAIAEGIEKVNQCGILRCCGYKNYSVERGGFMSATRSFQSLWDGINAYRAPWESNPWVFVISFKKLKQ